MTSILNQANKFALTQRDKLLFLIHTDDAAELRDELRRLPGWRIECVPRANDPPNVDYYYYYKAGDGAFIGGSCAAQQHYNTTDVTDCEALSSSAG